MPSGYVTESCREWAYRCHLEIVDRVRDSLARTCVLEKGRWFLGLLQVLIFKLFMQICPGWIQVQNLQSVIRRYALARCRNRIWNSSSTDMPWQDTGIESGISHLQICPGWIQVSNLQTLQICPGQIHESNLALVSYRYALARYRYRIHNRLLTDMPWLDIGIESGTSKGCLQTCPGWIQVSNL